MVKALGQLELAMIHLDDIIDFSQDKELHLEHLRTVLQKLQDAGLKMKAKKCVWLLTDMKCS